jgi:F-type H+-transporting ATPase subunit delta
MPNPRLAHRYAKSLVDLATEQGQLEAVYADANFLKTACKVSKEFVSLLRSPIIKAEKKAQIIEAVTAGKISVLTASFNKLLTAKGREGDLPEIMDAVIEQYNTINGIHHVKLTTAVAISDEVKNAITAKINTEAGLGKVELETKTDESLIGGFVLEFNNKLVDASIARDLRDIKKQFSQNVYVSQI